MLPHEMGFWAWLYEYATYHPRTVRGRHRVLWFAGHQTVFRFSGRPCLKGLRQRGTEQDTFVVLWPPLPECTPCTHAHTHTQANTQRVHMHTRTQPRSMGSRLVQIDAVNCALEIHRAHRRHPGPDDRAEAHRVAGTRREAASA